MGSRARALSVGLAFAMGAMAPAASADSIPAGDFDFAFKTTEPGGPASLEFRQLYKDPDDPEAKPSPVRRFFFAAPRGTVFDGSAVPACDATDQELQLLGEAACPPETVVGGGYITVMTGTPGEKPFAADATVFNSGTGIIELFTEPSTGLYLASERPEFVRRRAFVDRDIAVTPGGPPDGMSAAREAYLKLPVTIGPEGEPFITMPPRCRANGRWRARFRWTNADGASYTNKDVERCRSRTGR